MTERVQSVTLRVGFRRHGTEDGVGFVALFLGDQQQPQFEVPVYGEITEERKAQITRALFQLFEAVTGVTMVAPELEGTVH